MRGPKCGNERAESRELQLLRWKIITVWTRDFSWATERLGHILAILKRKKMTELGNSLNMVHKRE